MLDLLTTRYPVAGGYPDSYGVTSAEAAALAADGRQEELVGRIVARYRDLERRSAALVVVGGDVSDLDDGRRPARPALAFNARLATEFGASWSRWSTGCARTPSGSPPPPAARTTTWSSSGATVLAVIANRVPAGTGAPAGAAGAGVRDPGGAGGLRARRWRRSRRRWTRPCCRRTHAALDRDVLDFVVGAAHVPVLLDHLTDGALVITPGDRADLLVAASAAHAAGMVSLAGLVLTLGEHPDPRAVRLIERLDTGLAVMVTEPTATTRSPRRPDRGPARAGQPAQGRGRARRVRGARGHRRTGPPAGGDPLPPGHPADVRVRPDRPGPGRRRHLVLPEGTEERILRAAEIAAAPAASRDLTLLGDPAEIARRAGSWAWTSTGRRLVDPAHQRVAGRLRRPLRGAARAQGHDPGPGARHGPRRELLRHADGGRRAGRRRWSPGAAHTTAAHHPTRLRDHQDRARASRSRPASSSCCLADRVLVYGDCAVNPDPDAAQLADIAISSADTAARFGIDPPGGDAVVLDRDLRRGRGRRQGRRGDRAGPATAGPICRSRARSSTTPRSTRRWRRRSCPGSPVAGRATVSSSRT